MADIKLGTVTFTELNGAPTDSGQTAGKYWMADPAESEFSYERRKLAYPGQDDFRIKVFGRRGKSITVPVC